MKLQGTLTEQDFKDAALLSFDRIFKLKILYGLIAVLSGFVLIDLTYMGVTTTTYLQIFLVILLAYVRFVALPRKATKMYKESVTGKLVDVEIVINSTGFTVITENRKLETRWNAFKAFSYNSKNIFLFPYGGYPVFIARSLAKSDAQWNECVELLKKYLPVQ
jgi:hypothetical protein